MATVLIYMFRLEEFSGTRIALIVLEFLTCVLLWAGLIRRSRVFLSASEVFLAEQEGAGFDGAVAPIIGLLCFPIQAILLESGMILVALTTAGALFVLSLSRAIGVERKRLSRLSGPEDDAFMYDANIPLVVACCWLEGRDRPMRLTASPASLRIVRQAQELKS
jgi:hypothetical protein